jgi:hypothetical protein
VTQRSRSINGERASSVVTFLPAKIRHAIDKRSEQPKFRVFVISWPGLLHSAGDRVRPLRLRALLPARREADTEDARDR